MIDVPFGQIEPPCATGLMHSCAARVPIQCGDWKKIWIPSPDPWCGIYRFRYVISGTKNGKRVIELEFGDPWKGWTSCPELWNLLEF